MDSCCAPSKSDASSSSIVCPICERKGKNVPIITLKALLKATTLENIQPDAAYAFCSTPSCDVVYFSNSQTISKDELKVPVYQKDNSSDVPVCYCFNWTRERLLQAADPLTPVEHIKQQVQSNRCGCEVNNPQGSCCLGNVTTFIRGHNLT